MAQKILLRRGPVGNLASATTSQGELLLATGSIGNLSGPFVTMTGTTGTGTSTVLGKIYEGAAAPTVASTLTGLPFYSTNDSALYRLNHAGNEKLDLSGNLEGTSINSITASGSFSGSFQGDGSGLTNIPADNIVLSNIVDGNGIADFTYNGTQAVTISAEISGSTLSLGAAGLAVAASGIGTVEIANGAVTNDKLAGSIANAKLVNSAVTVGSTSISLGASATTLAGLSSVTSTVFVGNLTGNADTATTASYVAAGNINGTVANATSASYAVTASYSNIDLDGVTSNGGTTTNSITVGNAIIPSNGRLTVGASSSIGYTAHFKSGSDAQVLIETDAPYDGGAGNVAGLRFKVEDTDDDTRGKAGIFYVNTDVNDWGRGELIFATDGVQDNGNATPDDWKLKIDGTDGGKVIVSGSLIAHGTISGSFVGDGSQLTNLNLGSIAAPGNSGEILYNNAGALAATSALTLSGNNLSVSGDISGSNLLLSGNADIAGNIVLGGNITIGNADTDNISLGGEFTSNLVPNADNTYTLGTSSKKWSNVYATTLTGALVGNADTATTASYVAGVQGVDLTVGEVTQIANINAVTISNTQWGYLGALDQALGTVNNVTFTDLSLDGDLAINTNKFTVANATGNTVIAGTLGVTGDVTLSGALNVTGGITGSDISISDWGSISASLAALEQGTAAVTLSDVVTNGSTTSDDITVRSLSIGTDAANEISTTSGNLVLDSAGGTVQVDDNLTVTGNLVVNGTTTTVNSTEINIGDSIITLNAASGATNGGVQVIDTVGTQGTGSLLWNAASDYWYAGVSGSTHYRLATYNSASPTANNLHKVDANGRLVASTISDDGSSVTVSVGLTAGGFTDSTSTAANRFSYINSSKRAAYVTPTAAGEILQWNGSAMVASNVIDGGSF